MANILTKIFGSRNERLLKQYKKTVAEINALESKLEKLSDDELKTKTPNFQERIKNGESLDNLLPEAFAVVRESSKRTLKMRHFDVQLIGGIALHQGKIAEMRTGEGKTLTSTLPVYLNALSGAGVHIVTVNDYLASRDAQTLSPLYNFLGLSVGVNASFMSKANKQKAYNSDITYGTNNEYGFDYLRDNMVYSARERVQRKLNFAIVDEVDSILIDEARTPLIISGPAEDHTSLYQVINQLVPQLTKQEGEAHPVTGEGIIKAGDFTVDEKSHQVFLTEQGHEKAEQILVQAKLLPENTSLYDPAHIILIHNLYASLKAHNLYHRDQHYVVQDDEVIIVDEFTGRLMSGRRWSDGLHQAVEAKEGVNIQAENQTMASITFQNYFRLYNKLSGMTGTADTEAFEFQSIYGLETVVIPPNKPSRRDDQLDLIYKSTKEKYDAAIKDIKECHERGQPVLVGTTSIENSEIIANLLKKEKLKHQVLNAKQHEKEADIIAQAGHSGSVTIATNMAGRGTDIVLGGNISKQENEILSDENLSEIEKNKKLEKLREEWQKDHEKVKSLGGLRIVATERHESRRIDNQLRGRSGRQGDPGSTRFYLSLDDSLLRIFAGERVKAIMERLKMPEGEAIEASLVTRSIENAQRKVEGHNFDIRKQLLEYDDVSNEQRKVIYQLRNNILDSENLNEIIQSMRQDSITDLVRQNVPINSIEEQWNLETLEKNLAELKLKINLKEQVEAETSEALSDEEILQLCLTTADESYNEKLNLIPEDKKGEFTHFERTILLQSIDNNWRDHLSSLDYLRKGIHLRGFAQKQPKQEYKREAFELFAQLIDIVKNDVTKVLLTVEIARPETLEDIATKIKNEKARTQIKMRFTAPDENKSNEIKKDEIKVGRNEPCPCGSGKKYKHCCGKLK